MDRREVERIADLALVTLDDEEKKALANELSAIVDHFRKLEALDLDDVEPTTHPADLPIRLRTDERGASLPVERALSGAPERVRDSFAVPRVIE